MQPSWHCCSGSQQAPQLALLTTAELSAQYSPKRRPDRLLWQQNSNWDTLWLSLPATPRYTEKSECLLKQNGALMVARALLCAGKLQVECSLSHINCNSGKYSDTPGVLCALVLTQVTNTKCRSNLMDNYCKTLC